MEVKNAVAGTYQAYLQDVRRDAKGRREAVWYGNKTKTAYTYDPQNQRLRRLFTVNLSTHEVLQDLWYYYDAAGNITRIRDEAGQTFFTGNKVVEPLQDFAYDSLYRLVKAQGRETKSGAGNPNDNWEDQDTTRFSHPGSSSDIQNYTQRYTYDAVGNLEVLKHIAPSARFTRDYVYAFGTNKLATTQVGSTVYAYSHDRRGNMRQMPHLQGMDYDLQSQLVVSTQGSNMRGFYQYSQGQRMRKNVLKSGNIREERIYFGNYELYREYQGNTQTASRQTVHVRDETGRIAMLEGKLTRYIYSNHLQSATLELDEQGQVISYEEYHPYGTTSYQATNAKITAAAKRYRFTGKERDEESGLYYHGARYYAPWLGRWTAVDPINNEWYNLMQGNPNRNKERQCVELTASSYEYCYDNPINYTDPTGEQPPIRENNSHIKLKPTLPPVPPPNLLRNLPEGGRQATTEAAKQFVRQAERVAAEKTTQSVGADLLGFVGKAVGLTLYFVFSPTELGKGDVPRHWPTKEDTQRLVDSLPKPERKPTSVPQDVLKPQHQPILAELENPNKREENVVIFRSMKMNEFGNPVVEESARGLGVRPDVDISLSGRNVLPFTGGMSVAPVTPYNLPEHRRPKSLGGTGKDPVFQMNTKDLPVGLMYLPDKPSHGTIQPAGPISYELYKSLLSSTQSKWQLYAK